MNIPAMVASTIAMRKRGKGGVPEKSESDKLMRTFLICLFTAMILAWPLMMLAMHFTK